MVSQLLIGPVHVRICGYADIGITRYQDRRISGCRYRDNAISGYEGVNGIEEKLLIQSARHLFAIIPVNDTKIPIVANFVEFPKLEK